ncbi:hypothetical protein [Spirosoma areae]
MKSIYLSILQILLLVVAASFFMVGQAQPDNRVDFPHYVAIGPTCYTLTAPTGYNLLVEGGILTERLRVATKNGTNWADYVFSPGYRLAPLSEVQQYVRRHGHLSGIPSASQVAQEGIDVAQMQARMMSKIEELTLYVIRQEAEIARLRRRVARQNPRHR